MGETKALDHGGRVEVGDVWQLHSGPLRKIKSSAPHEAMCEDGIGWNPAALLGEVKGWRLVSRVSPPAPKRNDVKPGDRFKFIGPDADSRAMAIFATVEAVAPFEDGWDAKYQDGTTGFLRLGDAHRWQRISPPAVAPGERRRLSPGWYSAKSWMNCPVCKQAPADGYFYAKDGNVFACVACVEAKGAFADAAPRAADDDVPCIGYRNGECPCAACREAGSSVAPARPLTYDEANPRAKACVHCRHDKSPECAALRDGHRLNLEVYCLCDCHPVEAKRGPKVVGKYGDTGHRAPMTERIGPVPMDWLANQRGCAVNIDRERIPERPAPKVWRGYLGEIDPDFVSGGDR